MREVLTIIAEIQASKEASEEFILTRRSKDRARKRRRKDAEVSTEAPPKEKNQTPHPVANATAHEAMTDLVWKTCLPKVVALGEPERSARSNVGRWLKSSGPERTMKAIEAAERVGTRDPVAYITAALKTDRVRKDGDGWAIPHGTEEYESWRKHCIKTNSSKIYAFPDTPGHVANAPTRWPA